MPDSNSTPARPKKVAIITGGGRGLGRNTALSLAGRGVDVILTYHSNREEADSAVAAIEGLGGRAVALKLDAGEVRSFGDFAAEVRRALGATWGRAGSPSTPSPRGRSRPTSTAGPPATTPTSTASSPRRPRSGGPACPTTSGR